MRKRVALLLTVCLLSGFSFASCATSGNETNEKLVKMSYYDECDYEEGASKSIINENLFYRNQYTHGESVDGADPSVMRITDPDDPNYGKYVLNVTSNGARLAVSAFLSDDLVHWEELGTIMCAEDDGEGEKAYVLYQNVWAPEMIYDEESGKYYLFFSASPRNKPGVTAYENDYNSSTSYIFNKSYYHMSFVAVSDSYAGPFELIDHAATYKYPDGTPMMNEDGTINEKSPSAPIDHVEIQDNAQGYAYFLRYTTFDPYRIWKAIEESEDKYLRELLDYEPIDLMRGIDFSPFVDRNGDKYLYFVCVKDSHYSNNRSSYVLGIKMNSWTDPDYSTISRLTRYGYYEVDDIDEDVAKSTVENTDALVNEGPRMIERNGKYYLTLSINRYSTRAYKVIQAVSDSPLGPFRKLTDEEGGVLIGSDNIDDISGPGHHALIELDGEIYIVYHAHVDALAGGSSRYVCLDKVEWMTVKDKYGNDLEVMYTNGPTNKTVQPLPEAVSGYRNIAPEATVKAKNLLKTSNVKYLTDKYLELATGNNLALTDAYVRPAEFSKETTITLTFNEYKTVRAIMIYNSNWIENAFYDIARIEFTYDDNGAEKVKFIENLAFDWEANSSSMMSMRTLGAAIAEFNEIKVKEIRIKVKPATLDQIMMHDTEAAAQLAIGEIVVLGKD